LYHAFSLLARRLLLSRWLLAIVLRHHFDLIAVLLVKILSDEEAVLLLIVVGVATLARADSGGLHARLCRVRSLQAVRERFLLAVLRLVL